MSASENLADRIILKFRKLISREVFKLGKRLTYKIKEFKILFPNICNTYKLEILLKYVNFIINIVILNDSI